MISTTTTTTLALGLLALLRPSLAAAAAATPVEALLKPRQSAIVPTSVTIQNGDVNATVAVPLKAVPDVALGAAIRPDTELRILCIGDSITVGYGSSDSDGYRESLRANLAGDDVVFAGTEHGGSMEDGYFGAWSGQTIQFMSDHIDASLAQLPNVILLHAGTNDMNPSPAIALQGNDPVAAADRLGKLIDKILIACPDAVLLVAVIISSCAPILQANVRDFQALIPGVVQPRLEAGKHILAVDFSELGTDVLSADCVHPSNDGYDLMADHWYNFMTQVPQVWISKPLGEDPTRQATKSVDTPADAATNGNTGSAAWLGKSAPLWIPTAAVAAWHLTYWMIPA
ncbi:SGNH hydrolase-type esterase domain-containing protein [Plectosphaerella plurivora]|uniref:SGNH hydrolase-type esterase domain-containing protein n=1 Tax=Plectosphaerella plurivora TaxID=936078 RepID=A0A9P8VHR1_9PEZI|nr:SGNH hydrolase-type esterase domain-containing protein [Plectosphaerella plurivora]